MMICDSADSSDADATRDDGIIFLRRPKFAVVCVVLLEASSLFMALLYITYHQSPLSDHYHYSILTNETLSMAMTSSAVEQRIQNLGERLSREALENPLPQVETCSDLLQELKKESSSVEHSHNSTISLVSILENTKIGKLLSKSIRSFKRHQRTSSSSSQEEEKATCTKEWTAIIDDATKLLEHWKVLAEKEVKAKTKKPVSASYSNEPGLPKTVSEYRQRLVVQKKDMYKDPPVLPPVPVTIDSKKFPLPKRNKDTDLLTFTAGDPQVKEMIKDFKPNRTPEEVLRSGSFGGTYFRPITSAVTNVPYNAQEVLKDTLPKEWIQGLSMDMLTSKTYRPQINKYKVKCGGSLGMWESSGWIVDSDPYGWFQWYCRFYQGRRCSDDARQISRWMKSAGPKGRFRSQLCNKILTAHSKYDDASVSPVIRQTLLHWGLEINPSVLEAHRKRTGR